MAVKTMCNWEELEKALKWESKWRCSGDDFLVHTNCKWLQIGLLLPWGKTVSVWLNLWKASAWLEMTQSRCCFSLQPPGQVDLHRLSKCLHISSGLFSHPIPTFFFPSYCSHYNQALIRIASRDIQSVPCYHLEMIWVHRTDESHFDSID